MLNRRTLLSFVPASLVAGVARAQEQRFDGMTLRIGTWGADWRQNIHELIGSEIEKRGAKVEYVVGNPLDNAAKLIAARGRQAPIDVLEITDSAKPTIVNGGFLEALDLSRIPNAVDLKPSQFDGQTISVWVSEEGIVYNAEKFKEMGIPKPARFSDLLDPRLKGRVAFPNITLGMAVSGIVGFSNEAGGDEGDIEGGLQLIKKLDLPNFYTSSAQLATQFRSGDIWAAMWHGGWGLRVARTGVPVAMSYPEAKGKRGFMNTNWLGIVKGTKARPAAEFFINCYLDPGVQDEMARRTGTAPIKKEARDKLLTEQEFRDFMLLTDEDMQGAYYPDWSKIDMSEWIEKWNRTVTR